MLWAAPCLGYIGFMMAGEFTLSNLNEPLAILRSDVAVDSHTSSSTLGMLLNQAQTDPFRTWYLCVGKTNTVLCPVAALLSYQAIHTPSQGPTVYFQETLLSPGSAL